LLIVKDVALRNGWFAVEGKRVFDLHFCFALLRDSTIQTAIAAVARALLKAGRLNSTDLEAFAGSINTLVEAAQRVIDEVGDPRD
jgi:hypothetical protein